MRKLNIKILSLAIFLIFLAVSANAESNWKLSSSLYRTTISDVESFVQSGVGFQASLHWKGLLVYLSRDTNQIRPSGQSGPDIHLWSAGLGAQYTKEYFTASIDAGWYQPVASCLGEPQPYYSSPFAEGLARYLNKYLMPPDQGQPYIPAWDYYTYDVRGAVGGKVTLTFDYPITSWLSLNMMAGYRYLKLPENIKGQDYDGGWERLGEAGSWSIRKDRDWSAFMIGGMVTLWF